MKEIISAAGYIRVSTAEQSLKGLSIETQIAEIESYAKANNMKLEGMYIDRGITARKSLEKRTDFMRMMRDVESGKIKHIIVLRLDRFFRNVYDYHKMMNEYLTPNKCDWSAVKEQYSTATTNGRLMINLRLSIAEQECDTDSDRIRDVFENRVKNGFVITGAQPFGFKIENKRVVIDEEKREIMNDLLNYAEASSSVRATLLYMKNTYGISFMYESLARLLKNPLLYGSYRGNDNYCEGYISKERFEKLRSLLNRNIKVQKQSSYYIFSGLIFCGCCNYRFGGRRCNQYHYYRCANNYNHKRCNNAGSVNEATLEKYLLENVARLFEQKLVTLDQMQKTMKPVKSNRKAIEKKLQRLNDLYVNDFIDLEQYKKERDFLESQIVDDSEPEDVNAVYANVKRFLESDFRDLYHTFTPQEKQAMWRSFISKIVIREKEIVGIEFVKSPVKS